jgi:D-alanyl-D-alanine carboxypeptidase
MRVLAPRDLVATAVCVVAVTLVGLWPAAAPAVAAGSAAVQGELDAALRQGRESTGAPAATAAVMRCGRLLWAGANGVTDLSSGSPATSSTRFVANSDTKPVVAALVLDLVERGKLSLRTPLSRFYPKLPKARRITVRMLLDHTSGLNEYFDDPRINELIVHHPDHHWTRAEVLRAITKTQFKPGTRYVYTNSNYVVLGGIVEKVTGNGIERVFRTRIGDPLRLKNSTFEYHPERSDLFAHPYVRENGNLHDAFAPGVGVPADYWGPVWTDGGLATTGLDLARFGDGLFEGRLLRPNTVRKMTRLNRFGVGLGLHPKTYRGRTWLGHDGRYGGYETELWHDAKHRITIAVATNSSGSSLTTWQQLVAAYDRAAPSGPRCRAAT